MNVYSIFNKELEVSKGHRFIGIPIRFKAGKLWNFGFIIFQSLPIKQEIKKWHLFRVIVTGSFINSDQLKTLKDSSLKDILDYCREERGEAYEKIPLNFELNELDRQRIIEKTGIRAKKSITLFT